MRLSARVLLAVLCLCCFGCGRTSGAASAAAPVTIREVVRGYRTPYVAGMPEQMVVDRYDNVYSLDFENNHLAMFAYNGTFLRSFTTDNPPFKGPTGVAVDADLNVYVADQGNSRLVKMNAQGRLVRTYYYPLGAPMGVAVDADGYIYIYGSSGVIARTDQNGTVVQHYNATTYGSRGGLTIDCEGNLLATDMQRARALRFNRNTGALMNVWTTSNPPLNYPWNIAADCAGHVYIADAFGGRVVQMDGQNTLLTVYVNSTGYGVAVTSKGDVLVAPGGGYNVALMAKTEKGGRVEAVKA